MIEDEARKGLFRRLWEWLFGSSGKSGRAGGDEKAMDEARLKLAEAAQEMLALYVDWSKNVEALEKAQARGDKQPVLLSLMTQAEMSKMAYNSKLRQHQNMAVEVKAAMEDALLASEIEGTGVEPNPERLEERYRAAYERTQQLRKVGDQLQKGEAVLNELHSDAMSLGQPDSPPAPEKREGGEPSQGEAAKEEEGGEQERPMPE